MVPDGKPAATVEDFSAYGDPIFRALEIKYGGNRKARQESLLESCQDGSRALRYFDLRYYAECALVPTSVLYAYTHVVGEIARHGQKENVVNLLSAMVAAIEALQQQVLAGHDDPEKLRPSFLTPRKGDQQKTDESSLPRYDVNIEVLRAVSVAYNQVRDPKFKSDILTG